MSAGDMIRENSVFAIVEEVTEGVYKAPASATDGFVQLKVDGTDTDPNRETKERGIFTGQFGKADPRESLRTAINALPAEMKGSGVEGVEPQGVGTMIESLLGEKSVVASQNTTKSSGNTATNLEIEDADIADYKVGQGVVVLEAGNHSVQMVEAVDPSGGAANITVYPGNFVAGSPTAFSNDVVISKSTTYLGANTGHPTWSLSAYWANLQLEQATGCRANSMGLENFVVGELPVLNFSADALDFDRTASTSSPFTPNFDGSLPPVVLQAQVFKENEGGSPICIDVNEVGMSVEQANAFLTSVCSATGRIASRKTGKRNIPLTFNPYTDSTDITDFTDWNDGKSFKMLIALFNPSSVDGEIELGSVVFIWMPHCVRNKVKVGEQEGIVTDLIEAQATGGPNGEDLDIAVGFV